MNTITVSLRAPADLVQKVDEEAKRLRRSRNSIVNELLEKHYANGHQEPQPATKKTPTKKASR